jgi:hypothetical protein
VLNNTRAWSDVLVLPDPGSDHAGHSLAFEVGHEMSTMEKLRIFVRVMPAPQS